jgi:hypothetical protein
MREKTTVEKPRRKTVEYLRNKFEAIARLGGSPLDAYDLDRFLIRLPSRYYDPYLDSAPSAASVSALVRMGCPRWPLVNRGIVNEVFDLLRVRRERGLASPRQARYLRARGHPRPWAVLGVDVSDELSRLREGKRLC